MKTGLRWLAIFWALIALFAFWNIAAVILASILVFCCGVDYQQKFEAKS